MQKILMFKQLLKHNNKNKFFNKERKLNFSFICL